MLRRRTFRPDDPISSFSADDYNELVKELARLSKLRVNAPLELYDSPHGRALSLVREQPFYAVLSGSTSPYSWTESIPQAGDTWFTAYRSGTANAYETTGRGGLSGKRVLLRQGAWDDWRFKWLGFGCPWTITVHGCNSSNLVGETVEIQQSGVTLYSGTTNGSGVASFANVPAGTYDVVVTDAAGYGYATSTTTGVVHTCSQSTTITLAVDSDHVCTLGCCPATPKSVAITFTFAPGYAFFHFPDDTVVWDATASAWIGSTEWIGGGGQTSRYIFGCTGPAYFLGTQDKDVFGVWQSGLGVGSAGIRTCNPFDIGPGTVASQPTSQAQWNGVG